MGRRSVYDPSKRIVKNLHSDVQFPPDLWAALEAYRANPPAKRAQAIRTLLRAALRETGHLARLKVPEDVPGLEDVKAFPWPVQGTRRPETLVWFSRDPDRLTWATLFHAMEHETGTRLEAIAKRHGISEQHSYRIFRRFDLWRRGQDHVPRLDPFIGKPRPTVPRGRRPKTNVKQG